MKHIAITGGIGSGKSFVCSLLKQYGIKVYDCDQAAKRLWATDETLQRDLKAVVGEEVYINNVLQKRVLAQYLLKSEANKLTVDNLIHPAIAHDFLQSGYSWLESAILFDSGFYKRIDFDFIVCVSAPLATLVQRVMKRDGITEAKALEWIHKQWPQEKMEQHSNFVIVNDGIKGLDEQIKELIHTTSELK